MFWGLVVSPGKVFSRVVDYGFRVTGAALAASGHGTLFVTVEKSTFALGTLDAKHQQIRLNIEFTEGEELAFHVDGDVDVHLTGLLIPAEPDSGEESDEDIALDQLLNDMDDEELEGSSASPGSGDDDSDEDDIDYDDEVYQKFLLGRPEGDSDSAEDDDSEDEDSEEDEFDTGAIEEIDDEAAAAIMEEAKKKEAAKVNSVVARAHQAATAAAMAVAEKVKAAKAVKNTPATIEDNKKRKAEDQGDGAAAKKSARQTLKGGLVAEDLVVGKGAEAGRGSRVHVYYDGKLTQNNKRFDSCLKGKPFSFKLPGQVIEGWNIGVAGMRVGGKRRLIIPAKMGYGKEGSGPIPGNASLTFDIELIKIT